MMDSNINVRLKHTIHGTPTSKCWTTCNPWNLKLKPSDNMQPMELQPQLDNVQPMEINCFPGHMPLFNEWLVDTTTQSAKYFLLTLPLQRHPGHRPKVTSPR